MSTTKNEDGCWIWGAQAIGGLLGLSASEVRYLFKVKAFRDGAIRKLSHKRFVGDVRMLRENPWAEVLPTKAAGARKQFDEQQRMSAALPVEKKRPARRTRA